MSILTSPLPKSIAVNGMEVCINTDFRASLRYEQVLNDTKMSDMEKIVQALLAYLPENFPQELVGTELLSELTNFYQGGKSEEELKQEKKKEAMTNGKEAFSFELDADLIHAAFMRQYGIDLNEIEYLHWWKFLALFKGLDDENEIVKIMGYRTMKLDSKMDPEKKRFYKKLQAKYALPVRKKHKNAEQISLEQQLINGTYEGLEV